MSKLPAMTSKERIVAALEGRDLDYTPFCPFLAYVWEHFPKEIQDGGQPLFLKQIGADPMWRGAACAVSWRSPKSIEWVSKEIDGRVYAELRTPVGTLRYTQANSDTGRTCFLIEHPLKTEEDYKIQLWIEENGTMEPDYESMDKHLNQWCVEGLSIGMLIPRGKSAYQSMVEHHVGTEEINYHLVDFPDTVETLRQAMVRRNLEAVRMSAEMGLYEYYLTWEDTSTQNYSPTQYDMYIRPEIEQWCAILKSANKKYIQHGCGHMKAILPKLHAQGTFAVESLSSLPTGNIGLKEARAIVGDKVGIIGGIEPTHFLNLSEAELVPYVEQVLRDGAGGPFVLANSDSCPPGVTMAKFKKVADVAAGRR